jgi:hypothetical protein
VVLAVLAGVFWFLFLRNGGEGDGDDGTEPVGCATYRASLLREYRPLLRLQAQLISALAPVDAARDDQGYLHGRARRTALHRCVTNAARLAPLRYECHLANKISRVRASAAGKAGVRSEAVPR